MPPKKRPSRAGQAGISGQRVPGAPSGYTLLKKVLAKEQKGRKKDQEHIKSLERKLKKARKENAKIKQEKRDVEDSLDAEREQRQALVSAGVKNRMDFLKNPFNSST